jgi:hypothetical protein
MTGRGSRPVGRTAVQGGADGDYATGLHGRARASQLAATLGAAGAVEYSDFCRSARPECRAHQKKGPPRAEWSIVRSRPPTPAPSSPGERERSGGAKGAAASTLTVAQLGTVAQPAVALLATRVAEHHVMRAAGPGGFLLGVAGATVPDTLPERRHERSFPDWRQSRSSELGARQAASRVPLVGSKSDDDFAPSAITPTEVSYRFRS